MAVMTSRTDPPAAAKGDFAEFTLALLCGLSLTLILVFLCILPLIGRIAGSRDFVVYWATGQQLLHHANPYDAAAMGRLEHEAGFTGVGSYYMRNPPWSLPLALPLGLLGARSAALPWSLLTLALLWVSVRLLWSTLGRPANRLHWLGYSFAPALLCVIMGQTSLFLLLGMALFLHLYRTRPFLAGAALWFCTLKPHLLLPFAVVLLAWILLSRSYRILLGAATALAASCALTAVIDPSAWRQYAEWMRTSGIGQEHIPCLAVALRNAIDPAAGWIAFLPAALGCVWALIYYWRRRRHWDWIEDGGVLLLVSLVVAPYCWLYDQSLALPALLFAAFHTPRRWLVAALAMASIVIEAQFFRSIGLTSAWYLWPAPFWLIWYLLARGSFGDGRGAEPMG